MSSTNEELPPPPKPRASPLDFRNTDLVSRLLAATPPYLYNMPMVPNSYFFSEMLRSFVQAKADANRNAVPMQQPHRRSRKRPWAQGRPDFSPKSDKPEVPSPNWGQKSPAPEKTNYYDNKRSELPLELTMDKPPTGKLPDLDYQSQKMLPPQQHLDKPSLPIMFPPNIPQENNQNLILPPPPPMWYPPLYPAPYGIDPLHFFIDLRVSGHIYDRKNGKDSPTTNPSVNTPQTETSNQPNEDSPKEGFKQSRHASAFSVPIPSAKNSPMNLSNGKGEPNESKPLKFDVKSMIYNKTSTNYVMSNIGKIYRDIHDQSQVTYKSEPDESKDEGAKEETEEEREKRVKDLRALIGLELVVDYMNHAKPGQPTQISDDSTSENESSASPTLEVVALHEEIQQGS